MNGADGYLPALTTEEPHVLSAAMYNFLSATRRLVEQPLHSMEVNQSEIEVLYFVHNHPGVGVSDIARMRFLRVSSLDDGPYTHRQRTSESGI